MPPMFLSKVRMKTPGQGLRSAGRRGGAFFRGGVRVRCLCHRAAGGACQGRGGAAAAAARKLAERLAAAPPAAHAQRVAGLVPDRGGPARHRVVCSCAFIGSPCLRHCVHGASIGGPARHRRPAAPAEGAPQAGARGRRPGQRRYDSLITRRARH
jgi:hypothetical protein